jgi:3-hydroxyisobutyrate dehydrogenase
MRVAFLGLGVMGSRMAAHLVRKGFEVVLWNRTPSKADALVARGARLAKSPADAAQSADVVCTSLSDPAAMQRVFFAEDGIQAGLSEGKNVVDFSTLSPEMVGRLAEACAARKVAFIAAPVTGSRVAAESASLIFLCGGPRAAFDDLEPVFHALGRKAIHVGEAWQAAHLKLVTNVLTAHMIEALAEGAALAAKADLPLSQVLEVVQASTYASPYWQLKGSAIQQRDFARQFSVDLMFKDLTLALEAGHRLGVPMPGTAAIRETFQFARAQGHGDKDVAAAAIVIDPTLAAAR